MGIGTVQWYSRKGAQSCCLEANMKYNKSVDAGLHRHLEPRVLVILRALRYSMAMFFRKARRVFFLGGGGGIRWSTAGGHWVGYLAGNCRPFYAFEFGFTKWLGGLFF